MQISRQAEVVDLRIFPSFVVDIVSHRTLLVFLVKGFDADDLGFVEKLAMEA